MTGKLRWVERRGQDIRYAARVVRRRPGFALAAALTLALGLGANTAVFSILHGLLFESLPVYRPHELARLDSTACSPTASPVGAARSAFELPSARPVPQFNGCFSASPSCCSPQAWRLGFRRRSFSSVSSRRCCTDSVRRIRPRSHPWWSCWHSPPPRRHSSLHVAPRHSIPLLRFAKNPEPPNPQEPL